jgi:hypothetical protein
MTQRTNLTRVRKVSRKRLEYLISNADKVIVTLDDRSLSGVKIAFDIQECLDHAEWAEKEIAYLRRNQCRH